MRTMSDPIQQKRSRSDDEQTTTPRKKTRTRNAKQDAVSPQAWSHNAAGEEIRAGESAASVVADPNSFERLNLSERTMSAINAMGFESMTAIQQRVRSLPMCILA